MNDYERQQRIEDLQQEIAEGEADIAERRASARPDVLATWRAGMPPKPPESDRAALLVGGLRVEVERNKREASEALRAAVRSQRKAFDLLPEAIGEAIGRILAEHRDEIAALRADLDALRDEVETLKPETVIDMNKAFALRKASA